MTRAPHAFVRLYVKIGDRRTDGVAADFLPPKWFTKDPNRPIEAEVAEMMRVIENALALAHGIRADTPFDAWRQLYLSHDQWRRTQGLPPLLAHFGTSLVERALIDAVCRAIEQPFAKTLRDNRFGVRLGEIHPKLAGREPAEFLPERPLTQIIARHTIGLADPLVDAEIIAAERLDDGLPQSLEACIQAYGLRHFKVKIGGDANRDRERLKRIAAVIEAHAAADFAFSLDGNEQFQSLAGFQAYWEEMQATPSLRRFFGHLLFVEQPLHRYVALQPTAAGENWPDRPLMIIDESDGELDSLPTALRLGYAGTSHKNCKGVFKGVANACLLAHLQREHPSRRYIMSGEDLANIGPVALLQDLAVDASLGISSVERNGHHYVAGLSMFPATVQRQILEHHSDLYHPSRDGWPTLNIRVGCIRVQTVIDAPFGFQPRLDIGLFGSDGTWIQQQGKSF
jgi:hypothetical protein